MSVNGIGNSASSWAQFVKISQAARERTAGNALANSGNPTAQNTNAMSFKRMADMYLNTNQAAEQKTKPAVNDLSPKRTVGGLFDAYA